MPSLTKASSYIHAITKFLKSLKPPRQRPNPPLLTIGPPSPARPPRPVFLHTIPPRASSTPPINTTLHGNFDPALPVWLSWASQPPSPEVAKHSPTKSLYNSSFLSVASAANSAIRELNRQVLIAKRGGGNLGDVLRAREDMLERIACLVEEGDTCAARMLVEGLCSSGALAVEGCDVEIVRQRGW